MKLKHVGMIVVSVLAMSSAAVSAAEGDESVTTTVNGGVIHFKGEVVNAACAIDSESMNQTVELGQVRSSRLAKAGDLSSAVGFNIKLNDCDTNVSSNAAVAFLGTTVTSNDDTLALQSSAAGSAQKLRVPPTLFPLWRQCYFYCSLLAIAPLPTQLSHWVRRG